MQVEIHTSIAEIDAEQWNSLVEDRNPFLAHQFLAAMEEHGCVGEQFGWLPRHLAIREAGRLVAAMPLYEKHNSYGEFVFDHQWEHAWRRAGLNYFPKLVSAVPYTPATGQRLLVKDSDPGLFSMLAETAKTLADQIGASGVHVLFPTQTEQQQLVDSGWLSRRDVQFHWHNAGYTSFDAFLATLNARKRKMIRRERRDVVDAGVTLRVLDGHKATREDWEVFADFYQRTFDEKWGIATFNLGFFEQVARELPDSIILVLADLDEETVAGALMYRSATRLYGRHWGCSQQVDMLHFEACYYQGIEYAIQHGLEVFEPGAQGEHKIARGFLPEYTGSAHWVTEPGFREPLIAWTADEREGVAHYRRMLLQRSPYRKPDAS